MTLEVKIVLTCEGGGKWEWGEWILSILVSMKSALCLFCSNSASRTLVIWAVFLKYFINNFLYKKNSYLKIFIEKNIPFLFCFSVIFVWNNFINYVIPWRHQELAASNQRQENVVIRNHRSGSRQAWGWIACVVLRSSLTQVAFSSSLKGGWSLQ